MDCSGDALGETLVFGEAVVFGVALSEIDCCFDSDGVGSDVSNSNDFESVDSGAVVSVHSFSLSLSVFVTFCSIDLAFDARSDGVGSSDFERFELVESELSSMLNVLSSSMESVIRSVVGF